MELVVADITQPASLKPDMFRGVRAVICCTAVNVSPKEGDTPNRDKYKQVGSTMRQHHRFASVCMRSTVNVLSLFAVDKAGFGLQGNQKYMQ